MFGKIATTIGETGGDIGAVDIVRVGKGNIVRDLPINARDETHEKELVDAVRKIKGIRIIHASNRTFFMHHSGKIEIHNKLPVKNRSDHKGFNCIFPANLIIYKKICYGGEP